MIGRSRKRRKIYMSDDVRKKTGTKKEEADRRPENETRLSKTQ